MPSVIDRQCFRLNVGIVLANDRGQLLLAKRIGQNSWQFPQGGISAGESAEEAMYRELYEEVGLHKDSIKIIAKSASWQKYRVPYSANTGRYQTKTKPFCIGQKQKWFLLRLLGQDSKINLNAGRKPEFDLWQWVSYWYPVGKIVPFKRDVYRAVLKEFVQFVN